jgi:hypothetical protein
MVGAMRHNSGLVIVTFSCGSAHAKAGGHRYYYQTGGEADAGLLSDMALFPLASSPCTRTFLRLRRFLAPRVKTQQWLCRNTTMTNQISIRHISPGRSPPPAELRLAMSLVGQKPQTASAVGGQNYPRAHGQESANWRPFSQRDMRLSVN